MGKQTPVTGWYLEKINPAANEKKHYTVLLADNGAVVMAWGRIGTQGQSRISLQGYSASKAVALRQVYKKQSEGYTMVHEELKFTIDQDTIDNACRRDMPGTLLNIFADVRRNPDSGDRAVVMKHYDDFAAKANELLAEAPNLTFEEMQARTEKLKESWAALSDKHDETAVVVSLLEQTLLQRLMSGAV